MQLCLCLLCAVRHDDASTALAAAAAEAGGLPQSLVNCHLSQHGTRACDQVTKGVYRYAASHITAGHWSSHVDSMLLGTLGSDGDGAMCSVCYPAHRSASRGNQDAQAQCIACTATSECT
eukprot:scpid33994/ scgid3950/ 